MPNYTWSCLACGYANAAGTTVCMQCACPAMADVRQIRQHRAWHVGAGGTVLPGAALEPEDKEISPWRVLLLLATLPLAVLGAWVPFSIFRNKE